MTIDAQRHSDEMAAQRAQELAGDEAHYRLKKACAARAFDLYEALLYETGGLMYSTDKPCNWTFERIDQLLQEIANDAQ